MLKPLIIDFDYRITHSASGQIARVFWESNCMEHFSPTIICSYQDISNESRCNLIQVRENKLIRYATSALKRLGFPDICHIPDQKVFSWAPFVLNRLNMIGLDGYDYIHSISCPESSHLIALELKKKCMLPWIAQFNDPWVENEAKSFASKRFAQIDCKREAEVAEYADLIIHTNQIIYENWCERYGELIKDKMVVLPLSFNVPHLPELQINTSLPKNSDKFRIFHIGHLYGRRSAQDIFDALAMIKEDSPILASKIELTFIGSLTQRDIDYVQQIGVTDMVRFLGVIHPDELASYYLSADMFLVIDMNVYRSPSFPSKLMLYHYYQKPIIGITTEGSIIEDDLRISGHRSFRYGDSKGIASYLRYAANDIENISDFDRNYWRRFTVENVARLYIKNVMKLVGDESDIVDRD